MTDILAEHENANPCDRCNQEGSCFNKGGACDALESWMTVKAWIEEQVKFLAAWKRIQEINAETDELLSVAEDGINIKAVEKLNEESLDLETDMRILAGKESHEKENLKA